MNPGRGPMQRTGRGIPMSFQSPLNQSKDVMDGDKLPSYTEKTTTSKNSGGGSGSSTKSMTKSKVSASSKKKPTYKETYGDAQKKKYGSLEAYSAAGDAYNAGQKKKSTAKPVVESKKKSSSSTSSTTKSKTTTIGKDTKNQVKAKGVEKNANRRSKRNAEKQAALIKSKKDSTNMSNAKVKRYTKDGKIPLRKDVADRITAASNSYARRTAEPALGRDEATKAFPKGLGKGAGTEGGVFTEEDYK